MLLIFKFMDRLDTRGLFMLDALSISLERILCTLDIPSIIFSQLSVIHIAEDKGPIECISCDIYQGFFASSNRLFCIKPVCWIRLESGSKFVFLHQVELHFTLRICNNYYSLYTLMWKPQLIIIDRFRSEMNFAICWFRLIDHVIQWSDHKHSKRDLKPNGGETPDPIDGVDHKWRSTKYSNISRTLFTKHHRNERRWYRMESG